MVTCAGALVLLGVIVTGVVFALQGYRPYIVHTGSMEPAYRPGDLVIDRPAKASDIKPGAVVTFTHHDGQDVVSHRIATVASGGDFTTKGDANATPDAWSINPKQVHGVVVGRLPHLGYLAYFLKQPTGVLSIFTGLMALVLLHGAVFGKREPEITSA
jgi:signal peptidase